MRLLPSRHDNDAFSVRLIHVTFFKSLLWVIAFAAILIGVGLVTSVAWLDFVHGNPHRSHENSISTMLVMPPFLSVLIAIGVGVVFAIPQLLQSVYVSLVARRYGSRGLFSLLLFLPLIAVVSWYCFDILVPDDPGFVFSPPEWTPYKHGITLRRYLTILGVQSAVSLFAVFHLYFRVKGHHRARWGLLMSGLAVFLLAGMAMGYGMAIDQYRFVDGDLPPKL